MACWPGPTPGKPTDTRLAMNTDQATRVAVIGAGQLGRMLALAGIPLGLEFSFLDPNADAPAAGLGRFVQGAFDDPAALAALAAGADVMTYEFENIPVRPLEPYIEQLAPSLQALASAQDRLAEKQLFETLGIPTAAYVPIETGAELQPAAATVGLPAVLKARRLGYDGRGQVFVENATELAAAWDALGEVPAILEARIDFQRELSLVAVAGAGDIRYYPLTENVHQDGILLTSVAPAPEPDHEAEARDWLGALIAALNYRGVLTVEFFATPKGLLANEMAPRVHNSGHWTIEGANTSQFENHLRAVLGWPLGDTHTRGTSAMLNLLGEMPDPVALLALPAGHLHSYGKAPRPGRKLGHYTVVAADAATTPRATGSSTTTAASLATSRSAAAISPTTIPDLDILPRLCNCSRMSMYRELFELDEPPFRLTPDPQFLFASKQHARAKAYMESTIWLADGFVVITGEIGSGKTTLIEAFLSELPENVTLAYLTQTQITPVEFLQSVLVEFGYKPFKARKVELMSMLKDFLVEQYAAGRQVLLVIDEAQNLSRKVLEEVRLLSGIEAQKEKVLRIILVGQPELNDKLDSRRLEQLAQRVRLRFHLGPLTETETQDYIEHRLLVAGSDGRQIFSEDAFATVFRYSGGVPRLVNILCDTAMLCAFAGERKLIDHDMVMEAVAELQWAEYAQRVHGFRTAVQEPTQRSERTVINHDTGNLAAARLEIMFRDQRVGVHDLSSGRTIIGRTTDNDLQIRSKFISRHHAQIISDAQQSMLEDLNSTNGIIVGTARVKRHRLSDGDVILLGEHKLVYRDLRAAAGELEPDLGDEPEYLQDGGHDDEQDREESAPEPESV